MQAIFTPKLFLIIVPLIFGFLDPIYCRLKERFIPPISESVCKYVLVLIGSSVITLAYHRTEEATAILIGVILSFILFFFLIGYGIVYDSQREATRKRIDKIFEERKLKGREEINLEVLKNIGYHLVDPDFIEDSWANKLSNYRRKERRELFVKLIKQTTIDDESLGQEDLLVKDKEVRWTIEANRLLGAITYLIFSVYLFYFIFYLTRSQQ